MTEEASAPTPAPSSPLFRQASILYLVLAVGALVWIGVRDGEIPLALVLSRGWPLDLALGLGLGAGMIAAWELVRRFSGAAQRLEELLAASLGGLRRDEALALAFFSAVGEELFFRGAMLTSWGLVVTSVLFALLHSGPGKIFLAWTFSALLAGLALGGLVLWRDGVLLAPMVAHFTVNAVQLPRLVGRAAPGGTQTGLS